VRSLPLKPAFTSLAFSLAFSIFTFAEYARYFALYPIGAGMHLFFTEFVDSKDCGPVILSHFFLLCGCAGPLWLEGKPGIRLYTGVLSLGVGDSMVCHSVYKLQSVMRLKFFSTRRRSWGRSWEGLNGHTPRNHWKEL
jgi:hypothetical protein